MAEEPDRPHFIERAKAPASPEAAKKNRSNGMLVLGGLSLGLAALLAAFGTGSAVAVLIFALSGVLLVVGGLVIRP